MPISMQSPDVHSVCPPESTWSRFLDGNVEAKVLETLATHLENCTGCLEVVERLEAIERTPDHLACASPFLDEANCNRLVAKVMDAANVCDAYIDESDINEPLPERIGRFRIRGVLGTGGFGRVYLADDSLLQRTVAIKAPLRGKLGSEAAIANFLNEARHAAALDHPSIVPIYDVIADQSNRMLIVMKHIEGRSLADVLRSDRIDRYQAVQWMIQIARAVHFAHEQGFVHRDLKPSNILIDASGFPYVTDFGLGVNLRAVAKGDAISGGTPSYMSPEQIRDDGGVVDRRSDVWSLGVILTELLHGQRPFREPTRQMLYASIASAPPLLNSTTKTIELDAIIRQCLAKSPDDRYATAENMAITLRRWTHRHYASGISLKYLDLDL
jgi:eukaryotic-like serine/threonine-protein kinase